MLNIETYSKERLKIAGESLEDIEIIKEWINEALVGIKARYEIEHIIENILELKDGEKEIILDNDKILLKVKKTTNR